MLITARFVLLRDCLFCVFTNLLWHGWSWDFSRVISTFINNMKIRDGVGGGGNRWIVRQIIIALFFSVSAWSVPFISICRTTCHGDNITKSFFYCLSFFVSSECFLQHVFHSRSSELSMSLLIIGSHECFLSINRTFYFIFVINVPFSFIHFCWCLFIFHSFSFKSPSFLHFY